MNPVVRNILGLAAGWLGGSVINMLIVMAGHSVLPIEGLDPNDMDAMAKVMPTLGSEYFIFPFLAHALGTLAGATMAGFIAVTHKMKFSLAVGVLFLLGGITVSFMIPAPMWFTVTDILLAYIPMAYIGGKLATR